MKLQLDDVALFTRIAELGTLSAAARERNVPVSQITRSLSRLEAACGARLIHRTTHGLSLTEEGHTMLAYGRRVLDATEELGSDLGGKISGPSGWVRVSVSLVVAETVIAPSLDGLYRYYPNLHLEVRVDDRLADMARDGVDIAVRTGALTSDTLVARRIGSFGRTVVASPAYLRRFGTPRRVADLDGHRLIGYTANPEMNRWPLRHAGNDDAYQARAYTRSDNVALILTLARDGAGVGRHGSPGSAADPSRRTGAFVARRDRQPALACPCARAAGATPSAEDSRLHRLLGEVAPEGPDLIGRRPDSRDRRNALTGCRSP